MARNAIRRLHRHQKLGCTCRILLPPGERRETWTAIFPDGYVPVLGPSPVTKDGFSESVFPVDSRRLTSHQKVILAATSAKFQGGTVMEALADLRAGRFGVLAEGIEIERCHIHRGEEVNA